MVKTEKSVEVNAPPEKVWELLALDRMQEWMNDWKTIIFTSEVRTPEDKYRPGTSARVIEKWKDYDLEITESLKNEKITYSSKGISGWPERWTRVAITLTYTLKPVKEGTEVTYQASCEGWLPARIFGDESIWKGQESLDNLKNSLERKTFS